MIEKTAAAGKAIFLNKPECGGLNAAHCIAIAARRPNTLLEYNIPMIRFETVFPRLQDDIRVCAYRVV
jgi:hypothetical protein